MDKQTCICPGCGVESATADTSIDKDFNATTACRSLYFELSYYTLSLRDPYFIHQLIVDAYAAQHSGPKVKPITTMFALAGLFLVNEKHFTGKEVQNMHILMAKQTKIWPRFTAPVDKNWLTVQNVSEIPDSLKPDMIKKWNASVWNIWKPSHETVRNIMNRSIT